MTTFKKLIDYLCQSKVQSTCLSVSNYELFVEVNTKHKEKVLQLLHERLAQVAGRV